jgi:hypothetical protein
VKRQGLDPNLAAARRELPADGTHGAPAMPSLSSTPAAPRAAG